MILRGHNFVYKEHGSSKGVYDQPCESTDLTERHARMTKTQQIEHLRAIAENTSRIKIFLILCIRFVLCMDCQFMK